MKIQIFQHLPTLPKAGIFCLSPILCVAFRTFIPERSAFRCFPLPCLSMFRPLVPMHKSAHPVTHPAAPLSHRLPPASTKGAAHSPRCYTAITPPHCTLTPHMPITPQSSQQIGAPALATTIQLPPPHTQASKKDCPAQEQSFL